jgi:hypothetical protein
MMMYPGVTTAEEFMTLSLTKIKSSELEETLLGTIYILRKHLYSTKINLTI